MEKSKVLKYSLMSICLMLIIGVIILINGSKDSILKSNNDNIVINNQNYKENGYKLDIDIEMNKNDDVFKNYLVNKNLNIPNDLKLSDSFCIYVKDYNGNSKEEYMNIKQYTKLAGGTLIYSNEERSINISIARDHVPLRDYTFSDDNLKVSKINNIETKIIKYENYYLATFNYNNIYYDIETININMDKLVNIIKSIIN